MRTDGDRLRDAIEAIDRCLSQAERGRDIFETDPLVQVWMVHHLEILGEAYLKTDPNGRYLHHQNRDPKDRHERILLNLVEGMGFNDFAGFGDSKLSQKTPLPGVAA